MNSWRATVLTLFPEMFPGPLGHSLAGEALRAGRWHLDVADIRQHGLGRHRSVDDTPAGGGPGMVMRCDVLAAAIDASLAPDDARPRLLMSPRGRRFEQEMARSFSATTGIVVICGRFEGVDDRIVAGRGLMEVSLGDFVLSGGEPAALAILDACLRLIPGVMGAGSSADQESFEDGLLEYPHFTRPRDWEGRTIPEVLLSGNHAEIARWRRAEAERITRERRPDLLQSRGKS
jgi:tRNA (guanine37-N1)-methyltransferase